MLTGSTLMLHSNTFNGFFGDWFQLKNRTALMIESHVRACVCARVCVCVWGGVHACLCVCVCVCVHSVGSVIYNTLLWWSVFHHQNSTLLGKGNLFLPQHFIHNLPQVGSACSDQWFLTIQSKVMSLNTISTRTECVSLRLQWPAHCSDRPV